MKYYRQATEEDFPIDADVELTNGMYMSDEIKTMIYHGEREEALEMLRQQTGKGLRELSGWVKTYQNYLDALADFEAGKPIYVAY